MVPDPLSSACAPLTCSSSSHRLLQELSTILDGKPYLAPGTTLPIRALTGPSVPAGAMPLQRTQSSSQAGGGGGAGIMNGVGAAVLTGGGVPEAKRSGATGLLSRLSLMAGGGSQTARGVQSVRCVFGAFRSFPYLHRL